MWGRKRADAHHRTIDLQVNGYAGVDFNDTALDAPALDHALRAMLDAGVTTCLPTLITAPKSALAERFAALDRAVATSRLGPLMVPGFHLEGPFLILRQALPAAIRPTPCARQIRPAATSHGAPYPSGPDARPRSRRTQAEWH